MKHFKTYFILLLITVFLLGGFFHRQVFFPFNIFNKINSYLYTNKFKEENMVNFTKNKSRSMYEYKFLDNIKLYSLYKDNIKIDFKEKKINIDINIENNFFIISGLGKKNKKISNLNIWTIVLNHSITKNSTKNINVDKHFNKYGVRGCLNLFDLNVAELEISIENCNFENALEMVSVDGNIKNLFITNSVSDAIDVDFGNIKFENVIIQNSGSDCVDLNKGNYYFKNLIVYNCYNPIDIEDSFIEFFNFKIFSKEQKNEFEKYKIF